MSEKEKRRVPSKRKPGYQHFKLISEGGNHLAGSPGGGNGCSTSVDILKVCTTEARTRQYHLAKTGWTVLPEEDRYLFSLPLEHSPDLTRGTLPEALRKEFTTKGIPLSDAARINVEHVGKVWLITDKEKRYSVRRVPTHLCVYTERR